MLDYYYCNLIKVLSIFKLFSYMEYIKLTLLSKRGWIARFNSKVVNIELGYCFINKIVELVY